MTANDICDVVVVGGGPAGSSAAARLASLGRKVRVIEGERFPRFHIGESLLPLSDRVFRQLGVGDLMRGAGFVTKWGAQLKTPCGRHTVLFDFERANHVNPASTFQVHRAEFDQLLLEHAVRSGAELVHARARDYRVLPDGVEVDIALADGTPRTLRAKALVDASGRTGFVAKREGMRIVDEQLRKAAVYAHFRGVSVDDGKRGGDTRIVSMPKLGWIWLIPLKDGVMSVGAVLDLADYQSRAKGDPAQIFADSIATAPFVADLLAKAERVSDFIVESGFSYKAKRYCGERWLLAGDAGAFLDPIFSTGVLLALRSGLEAAEAVDAAYLRASAPPAKVLARYDRRLQMRYRFVRRFVTGFYDASTRDIFFAPRKYFGITRAVTTVLAGGFDLGRLDRLRVNIFFLIGWLQRRLALVPRLAEGQQPAASALEHT